MKVVRLRRGWRVNCTDNEFELLRAVLAVGRGALDANWIEALPYKIRKVILEERWVSREPLQPDEDRRRA